MIREALLHCPGIGPARLKQLHEAGIRSWRDVLDADDTALPNAVRTALLDECRRCSEACEAQEINFFVDRLHPKDRWRILHEYLDEVSVFDIETDGLEYDSRITMIAVWHRGQVHSFVEHENLDDFLELLDDVSLLTSFNGSTFDVPRVLDAFHIPKLPCPHLDLRWLSYHHGYQGGLKQITSRVGIQRPADLEDADGELAVRLWARWQTFDDRDARDLLIRYCSSDVLLTLVLAHELAGSREGASHEWIWQHLPHTTATTIPPPPKFSLPVAGQFGEGSPDRIRALRGRTKA